ncbi:DUF427-domain-containing protein [Rhizopogon vinicolor AM-OR11-026]|uniref:DUF427-domain-containing protein n=1 Tax=Rhizopogon vinicolor AM-OR11-026 TaxID=1314800 RepID=A0A1B7MU89_9AGAM|nr:DUF427-domain-containing protein [Rhizopogon vinicolor AM-OR11-026]
MVKVMYKDEVLAEYSSPVVVEGNYYFPPESVNKSLLSPSNTSTVCHWKGTASYYSAQVHGDVVKDIAWYYLSRYYPDPKTKASHIKDHVAFYKARLPSWVSFYHTDLTSEQSDYRVKAGKNVAGLGHR